MENVCITVITLNAKGEEVKRVTKPWYSNQELGTITEYCPLGETKVTIFHKCK